MENAPNPHKVTGNLTATSALAEPQLGEAQALLETCNRADSIDIPIYLPELAEQSNVQTAITCTAHSTLVGLAAIPDDSVPEASLMVHPAFRRRGIGRSLVDEIRAELRRRGLKGCLLVTDQASLSAKSFLAALGIIYTSSEYRLELNPTAIDRTRPRIDALTMRPATRDDAETLIQVLSAAFWEPDEHARVNVLGTFQESSRRFYLAELNGEPIGAIRVGEWSGNGDITAFGVVPDHQGKGYGRQILLDAVDLLLPLNLPRILIEVAVDNRNALGLYESCGFHITQEYGYYTLTAASADKP
jgi:ribosomal protein S18 acetylase RimI-like enzyme